MSPQIAVRLPAAARPSVESDRGLAARRRVSVLAGVLVATATGLVVAVLPTGLQLSGGDLAVLVGLVAAFAVAEAIVLHVEIGDSATTASLTELPLVLGLIWLDPLPLVLARLCGAALCLVAYRRQSMSKLSFNLSAIALEVVLAVLVVHALLGSTSGPLVDTDHSLVVQWVALMAACVLSSLVTGLAVLTAISLSDGRSQFSGGVRLLGTSAAFAVVSGTLGVLAAATLELDASGLAPLLVLLGSFGAAYRGHAGLRRRHERLNSLYGFVRQVSSAAESDGKAEGTVRAVLGQTLELLHAEVACLVLQCDEAQDGCPDPPKDGLHLLVHTLRAGDRLRSERHVAEPGDWPVARCLSSGQPLLGPRGTRDAAVAAYLEQQGVRDCVLVALPGPDGPAGTLFVGSRRSEHATFEQADVTALEGVAGHAAVALHNGRLVDRLTYESRHDLLTGLPNRTEFLARLHAVLDEAELPAAVLLMDLDRFKDVNDTLGHHAGDRLLCRVAERLSDSVAAGATVARLGGDEFAVVLPGHDVVSALHVAARLRAEIEQPVDVEGMFVDVGVSIGVAVAPGHGTDASSLMRRADVAMYDAKAGSGLASYDPQRDVSSTSRLALVAQLRAGLVAGQFSLDFQPQVDGTGRPVRFEALLRWEHPQRGQVPPDDFIPVAERAGLLQDMTGWVLRAALDAVVRWRDAGHDLGVAINLSPRNLLDPGLPSAVRRELAVRRLPADRLTLEITEGTIMAEPARAVETLRQLRSTGVRLSVDDFGTGYSSLSYLKRLPVDEVKIDKSFVRELPVDDAGVAIVRAVLALAASLHLDVVAEGVEDEDTRLRLSAMGCGLQQGFHISRPMHADQVLPWLDAVEVVEIAEREASVLRLARRVGS